MVKKLIFLAGLLITLFGLTGSLFSLPVAAQNTITANLGNVRVVNGMVGIGPVDVYLDGQLIAYGLAPKAATSYLFVSAGRHELAVRAVNAAALTPPIADVLINVPANESQTAIAYQKVFATANTTAEIPVGESGAFFVINDDRSPIQLGRTRLTVAHLAVGTPQAITIGYPTGEALLFKVGLEQAYGTIDLEAGPRTLSVIDADTTDLKQLARYGETTFNSSTLYTLVVVPNVRANAYKIGAVSADPQMFIISSPIDPPPNNGIRLRIIHGAHDTAVLDIYVDEKLVASRVTYGQFTEYLGLPKYSHTIKLRRFGASSTEAPLAQAIFTITTDNIRQTNWTMLLINASTDNSTALQSGAAQAQGTVDGPVVVNTRNGSILMTIVPDNVSTTQLNYARVRVLNLADGVRPLSLMTAAFPAVVLGPNVKPTLTPIPTPGAVPQPILLTDPVTFGAEANDKEVPAGLYTELNFVPLGSSNSIVQLKNQQLVPGVVYTFVLMGSPSGNPPIMIKTLEDFGQGVSLDREYTGAVSGTNVNVRSLPTTESGIVDVLQKGAEVTVVGRNARADWLRVQFTGTQGLIVQGWISAGVGIRVTRLGAAVTIESLPEYVGP